MLGDGGNEGRKRKISDRVKAIPFGAKLASNQLDFVQRMARTVNPTYQPLLREIQGAHAWLIEELAEGGL